MSGALGWPEEGHIYLSQIVGPNARDEENVDRVVSFKYEDGMMIMQEECDGYFKTRLDAARLAQLIRWLQEAAKQVTK